MDSCPGVPDPPADDSKVYGQAVGFDGPDTGDPMSVAQRRAKVAFCEHDSIYAASAYEVGDARDEQRALNFILGDMRPGDEYRDMDVEEARPMLLQCDCVATEAAS